MLRRGEKVGQDCGTSTADVHDIVQVAAGLLTLLECLDFLRAVEATGSLVNGVPE